MKALVVDDGSPKLSQSILGGNKNMNVIRTHYTCLFQALCHEAHVGKFLNNSDMLE